MDLKELNGVLVKRDQTIEHLQERIKQLENGKRPSNPQTNNVEMNNSNDLDKENLLRDNIDMKEELDHQNVNDENGSHR